MSKCGSIISWKDTSPSLRSTQSSPSVTRNENFSKDLEVGFFYLCNWILKCLSMKMAYSIWTPKSKNIRCAEVTSLADRRVGWNDTW